jgi:uncharacterized protein with von Willebrand factor type A (vWA) domain
MSLLRDLIHRGKRLVGAEARRHTDVISHDRFDARTFSDLLDEVPALAAEVDRLGYDFDYVQDLVRDVFLGIYKALPKAHDRGQMDPSRLVNHGIVTSLLDSPEFQELRTQAAGDRYVATMATLGLEDKLRRSLHAAREAQDKAEEARWEQEWADEAARRAKELTEQAQEQADQANADTQDEQQDREPSAGGDQGNDRPADGEAEPTGGQGQPGDGNAPPAALGDEGVGRGGPPDLVEPLERAIAQAEAAAARAEQVGQEAADAFTAAQGQIRALLRQGAAEEREKAEAEATMMRAWGLGPGELERMDFQARVQLAERLRTSRLAEFTEQLGRFRMLAAAERARKSEHGAEELHSVTVSGDLPRVLASEVAHLAVPALRADFFRRLSERQILTYSLRGSERVGRGPVVFLGDLSGSMGKEFAGWTREAWLKAFALALLDQARSGGRDFVAVLFASQGVQQVFEFAKGRASIEDLIDFAEVFFRGGTHFETPITTAVDILEASFNRDGLPKADMVLATDGECAVGERWLVDYLTRKERLAFRTFGVAIGYRPGPTLTALSDNTRSVLDLADLHAMADIFRTV